ncbi:MAG: zinc ribbon domain-containing protein [Sandaracinaceae bacterium]|nr:zinc ribbon domain-containing protein [Sandaracinaceae bacterium]
MQLPAFLMALAGVTLVLALVALWQSLRSLFGAEAASLVTGHVHRGALEDEKKTLLRAIKDLSLERDLGKISEGDFEKLDQAYRQRAKEVLRLLDEGVEPFVAEAGQLVDRAMRAPKKDAKAGKKGKKPKREADPSAAPGSVPSSSNEEPAKPEVRCSSCGAANDADALHCKSCATRLAPQTCAKCQTVNDADAKFCKKCAAGLGTEEELGEKAEKDR